LMSMIHTGSVANTPIGWSGAATIIRHLRPRH
jgi:hypothetical protein